MDCFADQNCNFFYCFIECHSFVCFGDSRGGCRFVCVPRVNAFRKSLSFGNDLGNSFCPDFSASGGLADLGNGGLGCG